VTAIARKNARTAGIMALLVAAMLGLAFASVPLYRMFCELTGFDGTPLRAERAPGAVAGQVGVRFDANIDPRLQWRFEPVQHTIRIAPGARTQVAYRATNLTARATTGQAMFNVTPATAEQTLKGGQSVDMPVVFFVDPKIRQDPATKDIDEITLSYTFYPVETPGRGG
jgi:cytochrome c oxidase assembly protein subunit 11